MKKIFLTAAAAFLLLQSAFAQTAPKIDSTGYQSRKLKLEEVNIRSILDETIDLFKKQIEEKKAKIYC